MKRFGYATDLGFGIGASGGYWLVHWFALEARARFLDVNSRFGSPWAFDLGAGFRVSLPFGPVRLQPSMSVGYAVFGERCLAVPTYGEACYSVSGGQITVGLLLGYRWRMHTFGVSASRSMFLDYGRQWNVFSMEWGFTLGQ